MGNIPTKKRSVLKRISNEFIIKIRLPENNITTDPLPELKADQTIEFTGNATEDKKAMQELIDNYLAH